MKSPCESDRAKERATIGFYIDKGPNPAVEHKNKNAVHREKIGGERDPEIIGIGDDVTSISADSKFTNFTARQPSPDGMREFMPGNIGQHGPRQAKLRDDPEQDAE